MNFNHAIFGGHLTADAKVIDTANPFTSFTLAVNDSYEDKDGTRVETVDFIRVTLNGVKRAPYLKKGSQVLVGGKVKAEFYAAEGKEPEVNLRLHATQFEFADGKKQTAEAVG